jgi:multiple sugar transport system ATP-binding protein
MADIEFHNVTKTFGQNVALDDMSFRVEDGEFFVILGHPGAGKTTTLRSIVGLERPDSGSILIGGRDMHGVAPGQRDVGIVFQNLALYPDKTVYDNLAFPLRQKGRNLSKAEIDERVRAAAEILRIVPLLDRKPAKLSGGERQRVAIGRVMTRAPQVYLLDEPLSALDALLRMDMRVELKRLQQELNKTLVYVTHDQIEAMSMADRVCVLVHGHVEQIGTPSEIYDRPATVAVARTVGSPPMNLLPLSVSVDGGLCLQTESAKFMGAIDGDFGDIADGDEVRLGVRPEDVLIGHEGTCPFMAAVIAVEPLGSETIIDLHVDGEIIKASVSPTLEIRPEETVRWGVRADRVHIFGADGGSRYTAAGRNELTAVAP